MMEIALHKIRHNNKLRVRQTTGIFGQYLSLKGSIVETPGLVLVDDVKPMGDEITNNDEQIMLVGRLSFMERMAGHLISGDPDLKIVNSHIAGLICLTHEKEG